MDPTKKRKLDENGVVLDTDPSIPKLDREDARKIIERFTPDQLIDVLLDAISRHSDVLDAVRLIADPDTAQRKLFIRGLGWDTTTEGLRSLFSAYGELEEAIVILDKNTGKSKGYGFVTFKHVDAAYLALKEPSKKIDGRMTVTQLLLVAAALVVLGRLCMDCHQAQVGCLLVGIPRVDPMACQHFRINTTSQVHHPCRGFLQGECIPMHRITEVYDRLLGADALCGSGDLRDCRVYALV
ncbi:hypothetical protein ABKV19_005227 [Rosa sericea]